MTRAAVFLDKDGTLVDNVAYNADPDRVRLTRRAGEGLRKLCRLGFELIVVSNQSGVARGLFPESALADIEARVRALLAQEGVFLAAFLYCPHHPAGVVARYARHCSCRKPSPGLLRRAASEHDLCLDASWMIGDTLDDVDAGRRAGCRTVLLDSGGETEWRVTDARVPDYIVADLCLAAEAIAVEERVAAATPTGEPR
jgi:D-glycero-D-manno-heptose 1,7-bisphosphate phosphatase